MSLCGYGSFPITLTGMVDPGGRAIEGVGLRLLACWDFGFESRRGHGCLPVVSVVCCQSSLRRDDHSSRGVLPSVRVCVALCVSVSECNQVQ